jgi:hypothetical protein
MKPIKLLAIATNENSMTSFEIRIFQACQDEGIHFNDREEESSPKEEISQVSKIYFLSFEVDQEVSNHEDFRMVDSSSILVIYLDDSDEIRTLQDHEDRKNHRKKRKSRKILM